MSKNLKELLVGTAGLARLGMEYADGVQTGKIDGDDFGIALSSKQKITANKTRNGIADVTIWDGIDGVTLSGNNVRATFAVLYGILAAEFDEVIDDGETKPVPPTPDMLIALDLLRRSPTAVWTAPAEVVPKSVWCNEVATLLAKYPVQS